MLFSSKEESSPLFEFAQFDLARTHENRNSKDFKFKRESEGKFQMSVGIDTFIKRLNKPI